MKDQHKKLAGKKKQLKILVCQDRSLEINPWDAASYIQGCLKKWYGSKNTEYYSKGIGKNYIV